VIGDRVIHSACNGTALEVSVAKAGKQPQQQPDHRTAPHKNNAAEQGGNGSASHHQIRAADRKQDKIRHRDKILLRSKTQQAIPP
jgi:hypothetical protein